MSMQCEMLSFYHMQCSNSARGAAAGSGVRTGKSRRLALHLLATLALCPAPAFAQDAGSMAPALPKQIRIITASLGGTGPDFLARLLAPRMSDGLRVSVIVENRPSANGLVAAQYTARATPDGSVMMMGNAGTHGVNGVLYKSPGY